jgi:MoxR-like ATPase
VQGPNEVLPGKVAEYLVGRLKRERQAQPRREKGKKRADHGAAGSAPGLLEMEQRITELTDLVHEKEDILTQIISDRILLEGKEKSVSLAGVLAALDQVEAGRRVDLRGLARTIGANQGIESAMEEAGKRLDEVNLRIDELIRDGETRSAYQSRLAKKVAVIRSARTVGNLERVIEQSELARMELLSRRNGENMALTRGDSAAIEKYDLVRQNARREAERLMSDEEVYYEAKRRVLLEYRRQLLSDGFVETPGVKNGMMRVVSHLKLGIPVLLRGHLGAGKTEMALHVSRKYFGCEPEFISGSEEATKYDIYGKTQIGVRPEEDKAKEFKARMDDYLRMNPDAGKKEVKEIEREYFQTIVVKGLTTSFFQHGPLMRAMREGKPLLIDEMDGIPHSIIMRLNHVLTRRPGDGIRVQESGGEEIIVKKGFCVIATGNIKSVRYKREELDAAFLSRWWSDDIAYPPQDEAYEILIASLLDKRGNLQVKGLGDIDALKRMTQTASEIQRIFSGEQLDYFGEGADAARQVPASLKKSVLSLRHLWNVVRPWKAHNFDKSLETYILNEFIKPSVAEDQVYLVQLFCRYRFFKAWTADAFGIPGLDDAKLTAFQGKSARQAGA